MKTHHKTEERKKKENKIYDTTRNMKPGWKQRELGLWLKQIKEMENEPLHTHKEIRTSKETMKRVLTLWHMIN